ncbi:MAG: tyrosine-type recombinase/integrase [Rhodocyclaceae bacterium]|nr:MAG: tyrosine-type recombinase/integrase [Rhodocyclaceae bacterium]CAG0929149.1 Tyrosine recombinase XerD [Rhodocyclaceae bacterium]
MTHTTSHQTARSARPSAARTDHITEELRRFDEHLRDVRGLAAGTREGRIRIAGRLLRQKFKGRAIDIARLRPDDIRRFLARQLDARRTHSNASQLAAALRSYFRYRSACGDRVGALTAVITAPVSWNLAFLPRALKPDEVERLLGSFTSRLRWPKRGYAIVRCALDMGLRCGEIAHLNLDDIDWRNGTVTLRGTKSLRQDILPLPVETGQALADYLRHERPATDHPAIFVRRMAGLDRPITSAAVGNVIKHACRRIGLPQYSAHALRHTLACRLVENGSSLKEVADVLRHRSLTTTRIYAKLDTPRLSRVPLPWPGSES